MHRVPDDFRTEVETNWSHEDNQHAQRYGFLILNKEGTPFPTIVPIGRERSAEEIKKMIIQNAELGDAFWVKAKKTIFIEALKGHL